MSDYTPEPELDDELDLEPKNININKEERKIKLADTFGKASTGIGVAGAGYILYELGRLFVLSVDTQASQTLNPADHLAPGLIAFAVSMSFGSAGIFLGNMKRRLVDEFNIQVKKEFEDMGFELVDDKDDIEKSTGKPKRKWIQRDSSYEYGYSRTRYRPVRYGYYNDGFWNGFWLGRISGGSSGSSRSSSRSSSSSSSGGSGAGALIVGLALLAAAAATAWVNWKAVKVNFINKTPDLLTAPDKDVFGLDEVEAPSLEDNGPTAPSL